MNARFLIFLSLLGAVTVYIVARVAALAGPHPSLSCVLGLSVLTLAVLVLPLTTEIFVPAAYTRKKRAAVLAVSWAVMTFQGMFLCLLFYTLAADLAGLLWRTAFPETSDAVIDATLLHALVALTLGTTALGVWQGTKGPRLFRVDVPVAGLPPGLDGFKIAQVSDLHVGPLLGKRYVGGVVRRVNALLPDMIALTGDFVDGRVEHLQGGVSPLARLHAREGVFFITGNHECYWDEKAWAAHFRALGLHVLWNDHAVIARGKAKIAVGGVTDWSTRHARPPDACDPARARKGMPEDAFKILLAHQPNSYEDAAKLGFDLQLSGHTHGGQFFPWSLVVGLFHRYYIGLHKHKGMWIYVSRGTGFWGPPLRAGVPAEITLLTLRRA